MTTTPKHRLRWYQFRLSSLLLLVTVAALILGFLVSDMPNRVTEEFDPVPDGLVALSWMILPHSKTPANSDWVIRTHCYAERPFAFRLHRRLGYGGQSKEDVGLPVSSSRQYVGHKAVVDCEFSLSDDCLTVVAVRDATGEVPAGKVVSAVNTNSLPIRLPMAPLAVPTSCSPLGPWNSCSSMSLPWSSCR